MGSLSKPKVSSKDLALKFYILFSSLVFLISCLGFPFSFLLPFSLCFLFPFVLGFLHLLFLFHVLASEQHYGQVVLLLLVLWQTLYVCTVGYWTSSTAGADEVNGDVMIGGQCHKWHCWRSLNMCLNITVVQLCLKSWFFHLFFSFEFHLTKLIPGMLSYLKHLCHYQVLSVLLRTQKVGMENISIFWSWILCSLTLWWFEPATICKATQGIAIGYRLHAAWNLNDWQLSWKPG